MDMGKLLFLITYVPVCALYLLPGVVLLRRRDWKWSIVCTVLGGIGIWLIISWIAAVVIAARRSEFLPLRQGSPIPTFCRVMGILLLLVSILLILGEIRTYRQATDFSISNSGLNPAIIAIINCGGLVLDGFFLAIVPSLRGRGFWGGLMGVPVLLLGRGTVNIRMLPALLMYLLFLAISIVFSAVILRHTVPIGEDRAPISIQSYTPDTPNSYSDGIQAAPPSIRLRCVSGQYAGAEFPLSDGETICFGSSPDLAHVILTQDGIAPLHGEVTYHRENGNCLLAHNSPVFLNGRELPPLYTLKSGDIISLGTPPQNFQILL